jgi:A/G-specific adenine glycosylase
MTANDRLLEWYRPRRRAFPWRRSRDPYAVWVSEVMLQQTQAPRVVPHFERFLARFPTVRALAVAPRSDVITAWDGLGYNRRAIALADAARVLVRDHEGRVPDDTEALRRLPGVGPYTAAAIASIAFGRRTPAIDTNVRRVVARVRGGVEPETLGRGEVERLAGAWIDRDDPGAWNQAVMDVGREHCRPAPRCSGCPLARSCRFRRAGGAIVRQRAPRATERFEGSNRQLRGAIVRELRRRGSATIASLSTASGFERERVVLAVVALERDGLVRAGPSAVAGDPLGRVTLPDQSRRAGSTSAANSSTASAAGSSAIPG